jgi:hypothetical protein
LKQALLPEMPRDSSITPADLIGKLETQGRTRNGDRSRCEACR